MFMVYPLQASNITTSPDLTIYLFVCFEKASASVHKACLIKTLLIIQYSTWMRIPVKVIRFVRDIVA